MNKFVQIFSASVLQVAIATTAFADISEAMFTPQGTNQYARTQESEIQIYAFKPDFKFKVLGAIEARGMAGGGGRSLLEKLDQLTDLFGTITQPGEKEDMQLAIQALRKEAASAGATGVIILKSQQVPVGGGSTERRMIGAAIRREN